MPYLIIAAAGIVAGILSGIGGGGGGMIMMPVLIFLGLPPQNAVATGKMNGLGAALGGLTAFAKTGHIRKDILKVMIPAAVVIGLVTPVAFSLIESDVFQVILGILLIVLTPTLFLKRKLAFQPSRKHKVAGYSAYSGVLTLQAIFGSGVGSLAMYAQTLLLGTTKLEANATKRAVNSVLTPITFVALLIGGYVVLSYGLVGMVAAFIGTHIGTKIAIKQGEMFAAYALASVGLVSGVILIISA